jgi:hypothetical protein
VVDKFIQRAIEHKGRVRRFLHETYGDTAFEKKGSRKVIKPEYLDYAEKHAKETGNVGLERAVILAKRLKDYARERAVA